MRKRERERGEKRRKMEIESERETDSEARWPQRGVPCRPDTRLLTHGVDVDVLYTLAAPLFSHGELSCPSSMRSGTNQGYGWKGVGERLGQRGKRVLNGPSKYPGVCKGGKKEIPD